MIGRVRLETKASPSLKIGLFQNEHMKTILLINPAAYIGAQIAVSDFAPNAL